MRRVQRRKPLRWTRRYSSQRICLPWSLRQRTERGAYAASAWHIVRGVADFPERREREHSEAA